MTEMSAFALAAIALLAVPGPTNTLLAASGAAIGLRPSLRLIPAEISGYLVAIGYLLAVLQPLVASHPLVPVASTIGRCVHRMDGGAALARRWG